MIKEIYICDFCKQIVPAKKDLYHVKVPYLKNSFGLSTPDYSICMDCYIKLGKEVQKMMKPRVDD